MITFYADDSVRITSAAVQVGEVSYPLGELAVVWHRRGRAAPGRLRRALLQRGALGLLPLVPLGLGIVVVSVALRLDTAPVNRIALLVLGLLLGLLTWPSLDLALGKVDKTYDEGTKVHEIWARFRGADVLLLRTGNALRFGRVYRALQRALETATRRG
ncbi:MAG TPA: DUF6232 family protein [Micromonosporaceae bacterium]|nr:DUF6232 family protein [Micromonosporaceae bacterium]